LFSLACRYPDEFESTRIIGNRQFLKAVDLFNSASEEIQGKVDYRHTYLDFSQLKVNVTTSTGDQQAVKTCPAAMGFAFAAGTTDGPGAFDFKQGDNKVGFFNQILASQFSSTCYLTGLHNLIRETLSGS
jgi:neutral ceramidase